MSEPKPSAAVVVCTRDRPGDLLRCLESLAEQHPLPDEVVVVSGSEGSCPPDLPARLPRLTIRVVECYEHNISKARNAGLGATSAQIVVFLDDDAAARSGWLAAYHDAFAANPGAWVIGGDAFDSRTSPMVLEFSMGLISPDGRQVPVRTRSDAEPPRGFVSNVKGCNFAVRRVRALDLGGFDPFFAFAFDEADLVMTVHGAGGSVVHEPAAAVDHAHTPGHFRENDVMGRDWRVEYASHTMFMLKHTSGRARIYGRWIVFRRFSKLALRVTAGALRGKINAPKGIEMLREARCGIREAREAYRKKQP